MKQAKIRKIVSILKFFLIFQPLFISNAAVSFDREKYLHFTETDGLPRNIATCVEQDNFGYIWIGTGNGIARYDGKNFYTYNQLKFLTINCLFVDSKNNLWVGTDSGLYCYNRLTNAFILKIGIVYVTKILEDNGEIYFAHSGSINKITKSGVENIYGEYSYYDFCISTEGLWCSTTQGEVKLYSRESGFRKIVATNLINERVFVIKKIDNQLLLGCPSGKLFVKNNNGDFKEIPIRNHNNIKQISKINDEIWIATDGNGIFILDKELKLSRILNRDENSASTLSSNSIYDVFQDHNREIWIATYTGGLTCILPDNFLFRNILPEKGNPNSLVSNEGVSAFEQNGIFYFGTNYGISEWNERTNLFRNLMMNRLKNEIKGTKVTAICKDSNNNLWLGTYDGLLGKYSSDFKIIKTFHPSSNNPEEMQQIALMRNYKNTNLLIVTHYRDRNLLNFDLKTETFTSFELNINGKNIKSFRLNTVRENQNGEWLALIIDRGLFHINIEYNRLENRLAKMNSHIVGTISDFYHDKKGFYWITSNTDGLMRISEDGKTFSKYNTQDGLPSNTLIQIESVDDKYLWISSTSGICRFDMETGNVLNFNHRDGLPANEFYDRMSQKTSDGRIIFGSIAGFTIINPSKATSDTCPSKIIISDITFQNKSIRSTDEEQFLTEPLEETKEISLPFTRNSFSIHFFTQGENFLGYNSYASRLVGLENNWTNLGETNHTNYTNLSPGTYIFEVKSVEKDQEKIDNLTRLIIHIKPLWYRSWYSYLFYFVLFFNILYLFFYSYKKKIELKKEKEISEYKIQKEHELTEKKLAFFTNISHDLKTPLTLIDTPVGDLLQSKNLDKEQINKLIVIRRNSKRLYKLITDLLDFRKITQKELLLEVNETDITKLIAEVYSAFTEECKNKAIEFEYSAKENFQGFVDAKKLEKILWNLISNAVKFTGKNGAVNIKAEEVLDEGIKYMKLIVNDKGIGISEKNKAKIFDRFYQVYGSKNNSPEGTGIGLTIVKELVEIHHGRIEVNSTLGIGTSFTITIPTEKNYYKEEELATSGFFKAEKSAYEDIPVETTNEEQKHYNLSKILVVEDNEELREYLVKHFQNKYKVYQAENGVVALKIAKEKDLDIILTDVQMPEMDGYEFCKEIRKDFETSHLPVVMLTASSDAEHQIEGLSIGADAYITKPFEIKLLDTALFSILENRKKLRQKFIGVEPADNLEDSLPQKDIDFVLELKIFIEENMLNQDLNVDLLSSHFAVSRTQLNRKIKSLNGATPNNFIKSIRLKKAFKLIRDENMRVSEAAYQTGFSDPNYFTICFKKEFGENPSQI